MRAVQRQSRGEPRQNPAPGPGIPPGLAQGDRQHRRFSELRASLAGISPKTLTDRLRDLEQHGLVDRVVYAEIPPRVEYTLTKKGRTLEPVISALADWGRSADIGAGPVPGR